MPTTAPLSGRRRVRLSRRALVGHGLVAGAGWSLGSLAAGAAMSAASGPPVAWRTWLLTAGDEVRPAAPPPPSPAELDELLDRQALRSVITSAAIRRWDDRSVVLPWTDLALNLITIHRPSPVRAGRALALLHVALFDALVATLDARVAHPRPAPSMIDGAIAPLGTTEAAVSSFPSEHAAVAHAAATVLTELFPDEPAEALMAQANEAAESRLWAGTNVRSDVEAGQTIGRVVGERAVAWGSRDGRDGAGAGTDRPTGDGFWEPTSPDFVPQPLDPHAGAWRTWVVASRDRYRPSPPPHFRSPAWQAELVAVQEAVARRSPEQEQAALVWEGSAGTVTPAGFWIEIARNLIVRDGLDASHAARVLALTSVAMADGIVCCWDAKYTYWTARPITADPSLDILFPTPPFPSYTSGHATISAAAATVLGHLFPAEAASLADQAAEAKNSRLWAGIHFPIDNDMGALVGGMIGRLVVAGAREDGAE